MDDSRIRRRGQLIAERRARIAVCAADADLDQLVRRERALDFGDDFRGRAGLANVDHGVERVRSRFQVGAFASGQGRRHRSIVAFECVRGPAPAFT